MAQDALQSVVTEVGLAISPLTGINSEDKAIEFFKKIGFTFPTGSFGAALPGVATHVKGLIDAVGQLTAASGDSQVAQALLNVITKIATTVNAIVALQNQAQSGAGSGLPGINQLAERLLNFLLLDYFEKQKPQLFAMLNLLGVAEENTSDVTKPGKILHWDLLGKLFSAPQDVFNQVYKWNTDFDAAQFLTKLEKVMRATSLPGGLYPQTGTTRALLGNTSTNLEELRFPLFQKGFTPATYAQFGITFSPAEAQGPKKKGIALLPYLMGAASFDFNVCDRGQLVFESTADIKGVGAVVRPPFNVEGILNLIAEFQAKIKIQEKPEKSAEIILVGAPNASRLSMQGLGVNWYMQNPQGKLDIGVEGEMKSLKLVIKGGDGDGFIQQVLSAINVEAEANLALGLSILNGFTIRGGAKFAIEVPVHIDLGPLQINGLRIEIEPKNDKLQLNAGANLKLSLGPLKGVVENIGLAANLKFVKGNLGPLDFGVDFKPPNGVGLSLDAGVVKGGGYLFFDFDREEYAGALELTFSNIVALKAIGIITTKMPDGSKGFSLLIIITAEFGTGIQLGFGFVLLGVGGLIGLNRTMKLQPLAEGVRTGGINGIMFPANVVENAPRIISDLRNYFPPEEGKFLIGPMAKLGWGTPALITLAIGIIIEIPGNIAIVGVLKIALPTQDAPLVVLQINFIGAIEFDKSRLWFFASLYDSRILFITLEGEMGLLVAWGDDANFVVSVGGFHPAFNPPPLPFPSPARLSLNILNESWGKIRVMAYFAVTSNTVQFGVKAELFFGVSAFNIEGHIAFDALFQFSPFFFIIQLSASVAVKVFGAGIFSIRISMALEGPTPYKAKGTGSISILFFDIDVDFEFTWGESRNTTLPPIEVMPLLVKEFEKQENWKALLPSGNILVTVKKKEEDTSLVLHPVGSLQITQRFAPVGINIDKIGSQKAADIKQFNIIVTPESGLSQTGRLKESFAMAQFRNMTNEEKLSRPSFEKEDGGVVLSVAGAEVTTGRAVKRIIRYEEIVIDNNYKRHVRKYSKFRAGGLFSHFLKGNVVAKSTLSQKSKLQSEPFKEKIQVKQGGYAVANMSDNKLFSPASSVFESEAKAFDHLKAQFSLNPNLMDSIHVIPFHEINN